MGEHPPPRRLGNEIQGFRAAPMNYKTVQNVRYSDEVDNRRMNDRIRCVYKGRPGVKKLHILYDKAVALVDEHLGAIIGGMSCETRRLKREEMLGFGSGHVFGILITWDVPST
jgi:alpha-D-ribose 1-methylphosphonate 5-triphosphate synthase subunit PhnI